MESKLKYPFVVSHEGIRPVTECPVFEGQIVYEVIRIINGRPLFFKEHMRRLSHSAALIGHQMTQLDDIEAGLKELIQVNQMSTDNVRIEVSFDSKPLPAWSIQSVIGSYPEPSIYETGVSVMLLDAKRHDPHAKVVNQPLVKQVAQLRQETGVFEVLLRDDRGYITEGSRSNYFVISNHTLIGVPEALILKGITRDKIIESAKLAGVAYDEALLTADDLYHADALLLSGTSIDLLPIHTIDQHSINSANHPIFKALLSQYRRLMEESLNSF